MSEQRDLTATLVPVLTDDQSKISEFQSGVADAFKEALTDDSMSATLSLGVEFDEKSTEDFIEKFTLSVTAASEDFIKSIAAELKSVFDKLQEVMPADAKPDKAPTEAVQTNLSKIVEDVEKNTAALSNLPSEFESITFTMDNFPQTETISTDEPVPLLDSATAQAVLTAATSTTHLEDILKERVDVNAYFPEETQEQINQITQPVIDAAEKIGNSAGKKKEDDESKQEKFFGKMTSWFEGKFGGAGNILAGITSNIGDYFKHSREEEKALEKGDEKEAQKARYAKMQSIVDVGFKGMLNAFNFGLEMFEKLWKLIQDTSPMLKNILGLFDTAIQLILMPIGNKIAEMLIPSILDIMDSIQDIWDEMDEAFEKDGLGGMITVAVKYCLEIFFKKLEALIDVLMNSNTSWLRSIGLLLSAIEKIMKGVFMTVFTTVVDLTAKLLNNLKAVIMVFGGLLGAHYGLALGQALADHARWSALFATMGFIASTIALAFINPMAAGLMAVGAIGATSVGMSTGLLLGAAGAAVGAVGGYMLADSIGLKDGGYVPATEGGELHILAEGGEGEYVVPESKVDDFVNEHAGEVSAQTVQSDTYNIHINGYTDSELKSYITDVVDEKTSRARIRAGF